jgi:hypothetical protein
VSGLCCGLSPAAGPYGSSRSGVQFNLARSRRLSMIWFSRSRLLTVAPYSPFDLLTGSEPATERSRHRRSPIGFASRPQCPSDARHLVGEGDDRQHGRLAVQHARKPWLCCRALTHCPAHGRARPDDQQPAQGPLAPAGGLAELLLSARGALQRREPQPCREVASSLEGLGCRRQGNERCRRDRPSSDLSCSASRRRIGRAIAGTPA